MTDVKQVVEVLEFKITELQLKPGSKLAMIAPEDWSPMQIARFADAIGPYMRERHGFDLIVFPHGTELVVVAPSGGFE
jgi:hypothetical protein